MSSVAPVAILVASVAGYAYVSASRAPSTAAPAAATTAAVLPALPAYDRSKLSIGPSKQLAQTIAHRTDLPAGAHSAFNYEHEEIMGPIERRERAAQALSVGSYYTGLAKNMPPQVPVNTLYHLWKPFNE